MLGKRRKKPMNKPPRGSSHYFTEQPKSEFHYGIVSTYLRDKRFKFMTASGVFSKSRVDPGTRLLIENMVLPKQGNVLDLGCGYGAVGIVAASFTPSLNVFLVDVNIRAIRLARKNAEISNVENVTVKHGCLYETVEEVAFDCILSNPRIWLSGFDVRETLMLLLNQDQLVNGIFRDQFFRSLSQPRQCRICLW